MSEIKVPTEETWRIFRIMAEFVEGFEELATVGPAVSIFGSARITAEDKYYKLAQETACEIARAGFAVITGGGGGIMEAARASALISSFRWSRFPTSTRICLCTSDISSAGRSCS